MKKLPRPSKTQKEAQTVIKQKNNTREPFNEQKLREGLYRALEKRPVGEEEIETLESLNEINTVEEDDMIRICGNTDAKPPSEPILPPLVVENEIPSVVNNIRHVACLVEKEEEFDHSKKNHQRALDSMQASMEGECRAKEEALRIKKKLESDINEMEIALDHANKAHAEAKKAIKRTHMQLSDVNSAIEE